MNIQIPDKLYKFLILISISLTIFVYFKNEEIRNSDITYLVERNKLIDSLEIIKLEKVLSENELINKSDDLAKKYNLKNPLKLESDSSLAFNRLYNSSETEQQVNDILYSDWQKYRNKSNEILLIRKKIDLIEENQNISSSLNDQEYKWLIIIASILAGVLIAEGISRWIKYERNDKVNEDLSKKIYSRCQSCYKYFSSFRSYSDNEDKTTNYAFCKECFDKGNFTEMYKSVEDVYKEVDKTEKSEYEKKTIKKQIGNLDRWKNDEY